MMYRTRHLGWYDASGNKQSPAVHTPPSQANTDRVLLWYRVWYSLTPAQRDAWQALTRAEKDYTYKLTGPEFAAFMASLDDDQLDFGDAMEAGHAATI